MSNIIVNCPAMPVISTSKFLNPFADREAQEIDCPSTLVLPDGSILPFIFIFPRCLVKFQSVGKWLVDPITAAGIVQTKGWISVDFPAEPIVRCGFNMIAQPITSTKGRVQLEDGTFGLVEMTLPLAVGRPVGLGLKKFIVDAVTVTGTVSWQI
jgi:hypothetical protein